MRRKLPWIVDNTKLQTVGALGWGLPPGTIKLFDLEGAIRLLPVEYGESVRALSRARKLARGKAFTVCRGSGECEKICYGKKGWYRTNLSKSKRLRALAWSLTPGFKALAIAELKRSRFPLVRIHDTGDFFDQRYLDDWFEIAEKNPRKEFYAYTKSLDLNFDRQPPNFHRAQSTGGRFDREMDPVYPIVRVVSKAEAGFVPCSRNSDLDLLRGQKRINIAEH